MKNKRERSARRGLYLTRPPRLEGKAKNIMMNPVKKKKGVFHKEKLKNIKKRL